MCWFTRPSPTPPPPPLRRCPVRVLAFVGAAAAAGVRFLLIFLFLFLFCFSPRLRHAGLCVSFPVPLQHAPFPAKAFCPSARFCGRGCGSGCAVAFFCICFLCQDAAVFVRAPFRRLTSLRPSFVLGVPSECSLLWARLRQRVRGEAARYGESPFRLLACAMTEMEG